MKEEIWASESGEILSVLPQRDDLQEHIIELLPQDMPGKVTEGGDRSERVREIIKNLVRGEISLEMAFGEAERQLPRESSKYCADNRVFASGWAERLIRTQFSRFYNQAVLEIILTRGESRCFVPISTTQQASSRCSIELAGQVHDARTLLDVLVNCYRDGDWENCGLKTPEHPHCTHVVRPMQG